MSFLDTVKEQWYQLLTPLENIQREMEEEHEKFMDFFNGLTITARLQGKEQLNRVKAILEDSKEVLQSYRSRIDNATEEDLVSDDLDIMVEELNRLEELFKKNLEYFKSQARDFM